MAPNGNGFNISLGEFEGNSAQLLNIYFKIFFIDFYVYTVLLHVCAPCASWVQSPEEVI